MNKVPGISQFDLMLFVKVIFINPPPRYSVYTGWETCTR